VNVLERYDAIVVGAGPAGSSAALHMASSGLKVLMVERGDFAGSKNMFGGVIYREPTAEIVPEFWQEAPLERVVTRDSLWLLDNDSAVEVGFTGLSFARSPYNKFTVLRPDFDRWLASKAQQAGAGLLLKTVVRNLLYEKKMIGRGPVCGVVLDDGESLAADIVVLAEGVHASLAKKAGLADRTEAKHLSLWVREVISLPPEKIQDRFLLEENEGAVLAMLGYPITDTIGLAGIFTNRDTVSLTMGMLISKITETGVSLPELMGRLKRHPYVRRLIAGGRTAAYSAHMIPKGGYAAMPTLFDDGVLVAGDAAIMISGRHGSDLAMLSGKMAAETAVQARARQDYSAAFLKGYKRKLEHSYFVRDMRRAPDTMKYYERYGDADYLINTVANDLSYEYFRAGMETAEEKVKKMTAIVSDKQPPFKSIGDLLAGLQNWGVL
jgi:electron transfer flavoprotein-quinone oxidoreductase